MLWVYEFLWIFCQCLDLNVECAPNELFSLLLSRLFSFSCLLLTFSLISFCHVIWIMELQSGKSSEVYV